MSVQNAITEAYQSAKNYPDLVLKLISAGVLSYTVDVATSSILYRFGDGVTLLHAGAIKPRTITETFNSELTIQAIRDNQQGKTTYPEFMQGIANAGVRFYEATLNGTNKRVDYIGFGGNYEEAIPV
ncbi:DUF1398 domain-containing protein [Solitalea sp. MAHUQ-68]|uniref:DUF1398 domain-containing protein n=1 Tax=Solitalea agri TaxID=2953739 RepID=A0A9X2F560_9SPHI|nr:DUF1398 family protein [Solitalea agri]MCO4294501.1 DUF1398 domain-containing protein [Solitalea agri]